MASNLQTAADQVAREPATLFQGPEHALLEELSQRVAFHHYWQRMCMFGYAVPATIGAISSVAATGLAASGHSAPAAVLSATTAAALLVERTLLLREKWRLHLSVRTSLEMLRLRLLQRRQNTESIADELESLLRGYAASLPIAPRAPADVPPASQR